ncbi:hypothetical protein F4861DRAFT_441442 [Xylaria intraflava]|nr:hypothetical protein F4861DRAFT_441442 [Xylaria intraflava]
MATKKSAASGVPASPFSPSTGIASEGEAEQQATRYQQAQSRLEPLQSVLAGLAHRNHNQHRRSAWWCHFGMLRRNCAKLTERLIAAARKDAARAAKAKSKKRRREELASGAPETGASGKDDIAVDINVAAHVIWLRDFLIPKCYLAFSQLTADTQFAPLGLVLLSTLAQVQAACECVVPPAPPAPSAQDGAETNEAELTVVKPTTTTQGGREERSGGRAISREDAERLARQGQKERLREKEKGKDKEKEIRKEEKSDVRRTTGSDRAIPSASSAAKREATASSISPGKCLARDSGHEDGPPPSKKVKTVPAAKDKSNDVISDKGGDKGGDKKRSKKKAKKGDEFDDLFKSLF